MVYPWDKFINLGVTTHTLALPGTISFENEVLEIIKLLAIDLFFNNLEIAEIKQEKIRKAVKEIIDMSQIDTIFGAAPTIFAEGLDLNSFNVDTRKKAIKRIEELIDMAYFFGSRKFAITSGLDVEVSKRSEAKKILEDTIFKICQYKKKQSDISGKKMTIVLETFDRDYTHKLLIGPTHEAIEIILNIKKDCGDIGLMLDLGHQPLIGEDMDFAINLAHDYLKHVHIGNCVLRDKNDPRYGDTHPYLGYPGGENGIEEVSKLLEILEKNHYFNTTDFSDKKELPTINFEIMRRPGNDVSMLINNIKRIFIKAWNRTPFLK